VQLEPVRRKSDIRLLEKPGEIQIAVALRCGVYGHRMVAGDVRACNFRIQYHMQSIAKPDCWTNALVPAHRTVSAVKQPNFGVKPPEHPNQRELRSDDVQ